MRKESEVTVFYFTVTINKICKNIYDYIIIIIIG